MEANEKDQKIRELTDKVEFLSSIIIKAHKYAKNDPEVALTQARKSAEAICRNIFSAEIGEPGKIMLDELIKKLAEKKVLPTKILIPLGTIQAYGNYGTHAQSATETIDFNYVTPCLSALAQVSSWYFTEYLKTALPAELVDEKAMADAAESAAQRQSAVPPSGTPPSRVSAPNEPPKSKAGLMIGVGIAVVAVFTIAWFMSRPGPAEQKQTNANPAQLDVRTDTAKSATTTPAPKDTQRAVTAVAETPTAKPTPSKTTSETKTTKQAQPVPAVEQPAATGPTSDPVVLKESTPQYPASMKGSNVQGSVSVKVTVGPDGVPTDAAVMSYDNERFQRPAIEAAKQYRFKPALSNGKPVQGTAYIKMTFKEE
jgi:TonB family protein